MTSTVSKLLNRLNGIIKYIYYNIFVIFQLNCFLELRFVDFLMISRLQYMLTFI